MPANVDALVVFAFGATVASIWLALALAQLGAFSAFGAWLSIAIGLACGAALAWTVGTHQIGWPSARASILAVGVVAAMLWILARPHQVVFGGLDPGVYVATASQIAREGGLVWRDRALGELSPAARAVLFREPPTSYAEGSRLVGFYFRSVGDATIVPHGVYALPAAMALGASTLGVRWALAVPIGLALLTAAAIGSLAYRARGGFAALASVAFLATMPLDTWFARYPAAEIAQQFLLFGGLAMAAIGYARGSHAIAVAAGASLGLIHAAKIETFTVLVAIVAFLAWRWARGTLTTFDRWLALGYAIAALHAVVLATTVATHYAATNYLRYVPPLGVLLAVGAAAITVVAVMIVRPALARALVVAVENRLSGSGGLVSVVVVAAALALWFIRPLDVLGEVAVTPEPLIASVRNRLEWVSRLAWMVPWPILALALAGAASTARRRWPAPFALGLTIVVLDLVVTAIDPRITPVYPWAARRWVGTAAPAIALFSGFALAIGVSVLGRWAGPRVARAAAVILIAGGAVLGLSQAPALLVHREYGGSLDVIQRIATDIPAGAIVLVDDDPLGVWLASPLDRIADRPTFALFGEAARDPAMAMVLDEWAAHGRDIYWVRARSGPFDAFDRSWTPAGHHAVEIFEAVPTIDRAPRETRPVSIDATVFRGTLRP
ncbi:MAG: hypothetical protein EPO26_00905 [Chloroflexota bacterium]|nr:MAG: hypothetical protein EPO26_00905 [Chloroflexota bacterium]